MNKHITKRETTVPRALARTITEPTSLRNSRQFYLLRCLEPITLDEVETQPYSIRVYIRPTRPDAGSH